MCGFKVQEDVEMRFVEEEGKTYEEAVEKALSSLGIEPEQADIMILEEGSRGVFNIGGKPWKVKVSHVWDEEAAKKIVSELLAKMGVEADVDVLEKDGIYFVDISTSGADGLLIGKYGKTLDALQHVVARMVNQLRPRTKVVLDVGKYKERQHDMLRRKAFGLAEKVKETRKEIVMEPLRPSERRVVHLALAEDPGVRTYTVGEGSDRSVVVAPNVVKESRTQPQEARESDEGGYNRGDLNPSGGGGNRSGEDERGEGF